MAHSRVPGSGTSPMMTNTMNYNSPPNKADGFHGTMPLQNNFTQGKGFNYQQPMQQTVGNKSGGGSHFGMQLIGSETQHSTNFLPSQYQLQSTGLTSKLNEQFQLAKQEQQAQYNSKCISFSISPPKQKF